MVSAFSANCLSSFTTFSFPGRISYLARHSCSGSIPILRTSCSRPFFSLYLAFCSGDIFRVFAAWAARSFGSDEPELLPDVGRSRMCPTLDLTIKSLPRYLLIVFAFAGDSTITSALPIILLHGLRSDLNFNVSRVAIYRDAKPLGQAKI